MEFASLLREGFGWARAQNICVPNITIEADCPLSLGRALRSP